MNSQNVGEKNNWLVVKAAITLLFWVFVLLVLLLPVGGKSVTYVTFILLVWAIFFGANNLRTIKALRHYSKYGLTPQQVKQINAEFRAVLRAMVFFVAIIGISSVDIVQNSKALGIVSFVKLFVGALIANWCFIFGVYASRAREKAKSTIHYRLAAAKLKRLNFVQTTLTLLAITVLWYWLALSAEMPAAYVVVAGLIYVQVAWALSYALLYVVKESGMLWPLVLPILHGRYMKFGQGVMAPYFAVSMPLTQVFDGKSNVFSLEYLRGSTFDLLYREIGKSANAAFRGKEMSLLVYDRTHGIFVFAQRVLGVEVPVVVVLMHLDPDKEVMVQATVYVLWFMRSKAIKLSNALRENLEKQTVLTDSVSTRVTWLI
uniref:Uncharacterized protein n=1 Tax=candidate division WWE3 bacterium TaxID=2053526 RepID=A0A7C4XT78_UNCKA